MDIKGSVEQAGGRAGATGGIGWKAALRFALYLLLLPAVLFGAAGSLNWAMGWAYVLVSFAATAVSRFVVLRQNPDLIAERGKYMEGEGVKSWDRVIVPLVAQVGPLAVLIVAGLNRRFGWWPEVAPRVQIAALVIVVLGAALATWAMAVNRFFSAVVRIQKERGHTVIASGPYRFVRHPGYAGGVIMYLVTPLLLGSVWAYVPALLTVLLTILRTALEDRTLLEELHGYKDYAQRVRYRLLPGIW